MSNPASILKSVLIIILVFWVGVVLGLFFLSLMHEITTAIIGA